MNKTHTKNWSMCKQKEKKTSEHVSNKQNFTKDLIIYYKQNQTILLTQLE